MPPKAPPPADSGDTTLLAQAIDTIHHRFDNRPIRDFVPVLVERYAREELKASTPNTPKPAG